MAWRLVAQAQFNRIDPKSLGELIHGALEGELANSLPRGTHRNCQQHRPLPVQPFCLNLPRNMAFSTTYARRP